MATLSGANFGGTQIGHQYNFNGMDTTFVYYEMA